jgi:hypothetical protein
MKKPRTTDSVVRARYSLNVVKGANQRWLNPPRGSGAKNENLG